ncbi:GNAT family N-acetyltransferase [Virgibacillus soli]|uniref:GNAT family N-acetyltransferase n=1 Tax=Paracerasibacillus soli TaxID=480284 RepID=A0ABU5CTR0_9BACI|nr:GNAT family N-acetyltransferase [Virgibacillus soli]MDY0409759.1 GNAT family N-acetyltransferase [Virgibacillus soli]
MKLVIKDVNKDNWRQVAALKVAHEQSDYIESNLYSIAQSAFETYWKSRALYAGDTLIGYAMYGAFSDKEKTVWLDRFMIDITYQGKGYAKQFLPMLIREIKELYPCNRIYLSVVLENKVAIRMYEKLGFRFNGDIDDTEVIAGHVMELTLT